MEENPSNNKKINPEESSSELESIRTYEKDMARILKEQQSSLNTVFMAEEKKRAEGKKEEPEERPEVSTVKNQLYFVFGILLLILALGSIFAAWLFFFKDSKDKTPAVDTGSYIVSDEIREISLYLSAQNIEAALRESRLESSLEANKVLAIEFIKEKPDGSKQDAPLSEVIDALAWRMPDELERALDGSYAFGIHSFGGNEPFIVFGIESYEQAFASMLDWEKVLMSDLVPFFKEPQPDTVSIPISNSTTTATTTATTTVYQESNVSTNLSFKDAVIRNKDARILEKNGVIYIVYSFIDRETLVITTNPDTLYEAAERKPKDF